MKRTSVPSLLVFSILSVGLVGTDSWGFAGKDGADFLNIPLGGRPAALGGAYSSLASDAYATVYNPGGLGFLTNPQLAAMHVETIDSVAYEFASVAFPLSKRGSLGASAQYLRPGDIPSTDLAGNSIGSFSGSDLAASLAYGHRLTNMVSLGVAGRFIQSKIADESATAFAGDAGTMIRPNENLRLAATVSNIGSKLKFIQEGDALPLAFRLGGAYQFIDAWTVALQGTYLKDGSLSGQSGLEWKIGEVLSMRVGYRTDNTKELSGVAGLTAGIGIMLAGQMFDYAWVPMGDLGDAHYFSFLFQWGREQ